MSTDPNRPNDPNNSNNPNGLDPSQTIGKRMMAIAWIFAILILTWIFGLWEAQQFNPNQSPKSYNTQGATEVTLKRNRYGHYLVTGYVNRKTAQFMLDTGATVVAIPGELQQELNLTSGNLYYTETANGRAKAYATVIDELEIGEIKLRNVPASIVPNMQGRNILLGMSVLKQLEFTQKGNQLTLRQLN